MSATGEFVDAIRAAGIEPPEYIEADGKLHRFPTNGKRGDDSGWYVLHGDGIAAGAFGCHRLGIDERWRESVRRELSPEERRAHKQRMDELRRQRDAEKERRQAEAAERAGKLSEAARPETGEHRYLRNKGIQPHGVRTDGHSLMVPMRDISGALCSIQHIGPDGSKKFLPGGRVTGCYYAIGKPDGVLCIAEGFATAATIHQATGHAVAAAFNAGNLKPVCEALREKFPDARLIVCADDDHTTEGNPGLTKATEAARAVGGLLAVPEFGDDRPDGATDFNDLRDPEAVRRAIDSAKPPGTVGRATEPEIVYRRVSDIQARPIQWLWPSRIARGKVSMIAGHPGLGKSQVTASIAAIVTTGGRWPVDRTPCEQGSVVILSAEDDAEDTIRPRLEAAGADVSRVYILDAIQEWPDDGDPYTRSFSLKTDLQRLGDLLAKIGNVAMVVIDPISAYLGGTDSHKNADVRALLAPLTELAGRHGAAVVCVSHLNKGGGNEALTRITGSLAFVAAARAAFVVAKDKDDERRRLFLPVKNNVGNDETGLAFMVEAHTLGEIETSRVSWEPEAVTVTAEDALSYEDGGERSERQEAEEWLRDALSDGPMAAKEVRKQAEAAGLAWATVRRAKDSIGIKPSKTHFSGGWQWALPKVLNNSPFQKGEHLRGSGASSTETTSYRGEFGGNSPQGAQGAQPGGLDPFVDPLGESGEWEASV